MNIELTKKLWEKYPLIFQGRYKSIQESLIPFGFECGNGWYTLIDRLCSHLQWNTDNNNKDYVIENKLLRFFIPKIDKLISYIPGRYNFKRKKQTNPLVILRHFLLGVLHDLKTKHLKYIYIESNRYPQVIATQVKEKFGGLRFYERGCNKDYPAISFAESLSYHICEKCGSTKNVGQTDGWIYTRCEECAKAEDLISETDFTWKSHEDRKEEDNET